MIVAECPHLRSYIRICINVHRRRRRRRCGVSTIILTLPRIPLNDYYLVFASSSLPSPWNRESSHFEEGKSGTSEIVGFFSAVDTRRYSVGDMSCLARTIVTIIAEPVSSRTLKIEIKIAL